MIVVGIDEVGQDAGAGPLVAGAVILPAMLTIKEGPIVLRDSKKMSKLQREITATWIHENALGVGLGWVPASEVDELGITESVRVAMQRALAEISIEYDHIIIDGSINYFAQNPKAQAVVKADDSVPAVSAASIVAKVARDAFMSSLGEAYEGYGFGNHVGYGTAAHIAALQKLGVSDLHRKSFKPIKAMLA